MRHALLSLAVFLILSTTGYCAGDGKIVFVDVNKVLQQSKSGMQALQTFNNFAMAKKEKITVKMDEVNKLEADFIQKSGALSEAAKKKKQDDILEQKRLLQKMQNDAQTEVMQKQVELVEPIYKEMKDLLAKIAKENGYTAILQKIDVLPLHHHTRTPDGNMAIVPDVRPFLLYLDDNIDITDIVIQRYNSIRK